ncbi:MAG: ABC transporter ATP-binding protein [Alicyclobacillus sp.]|nr:ABC transporter ATP-binding protein [Alicyclobacillus sp.]
MIELKGLSKTFIAKRKGMFDRQRRVIHAVREVNLAWEQGKFLAIVGESGCGKSTLGRMIAGIIPATSGGLLLDGKDMTHLNGQRKRDWARTVQLIPQDPYAALNPVRTIKSSLAEPLLYHRLTTRRTLNDRLDALLNMVGLDATNVLNKYPHQLSGGQRQRVVVARALTLEPQYLIADESVSMVDVSLRLGILENMRSISRQRRLGLMFITHDFRVARYIAQGGHIAVMYLGRIIEFGPTEEILTSPQHPYTQSLISAVPLLEGKERHIEEVVPKSYELSVESVPKNGCAFEPRCPFATDKCRTSVPALHRLDGQEHAVACHHASARQLLASTN